MIWYSKPKTLRGHIEHLPSRVLAAGNIRLDGVVTMTGGDFQFSPDTRLYIDEDSRLTAGGFSSFKVGEIIGTKAGIEHPAVELFPADPLINSRNRWEPVNKLRIYHDTRRTDWWDDEPQFFKSVHHGGNVVVLHLNRKRFSEWLDGSIKHYEHNRWLVNGKKPQGVKVTEEGLVELTFEYPIPAGLISFWTDCPEKFQRNIHIGRLMASDSPVGALSMYGAVSARIDSIQTHGGIDAVTLEYCRGCRVGEVFGIDTHTKWDGALLVELFLAERNSVGATNGVVKVQSYGAYTEKETPDSILP